MDSPPSAVSASRAAFPSGTDLDVVTAAFGPKPLVLDQLAARVRLPVPRILAALTRLELTGSVRRTGEGWAATRPRR